MPLWGEVQPKHPGIAEALRTLPSLAARRVGPLLVAGHAHRAATQLSCWKQGYDGHGDGHGGFIWCQSEFIMPLILVIGLNRN